MVLPLHRICVVSNHDHDYRKNGLQQLLEVFAKQILTYSSDITVTDEIKTPWPTFVQAVSSIRARRHIAELKFPPGPPPMQLFAPHILQLASSSPPRYFHSIRYRQWVSKYLFYFNWHRGNAFAWTGNFTFGASGIKGSQWTPMNVLQESVWFLWDYYYVLRAPLLW